MQSDFSVRVSVCCYRTVLQMKLHNTSPRAVYSLPKIYQKNKTHTVLFALAYWLNNLSAFLPGRFILRCGSAQRRGTAGGSTYRFAGCGVPVVTLPFPRLESVHKLHGLLRLLFSHLCDGNTVFTRCVCVGQGRVKVNKSDTARKVSGI